MIEGFDEQDRQSVRLAVAALAMQALIVRGREAFPNIQAEADSRAAHAVLMADALLKKLGMCDG